MIFHVWETKVASTPWASATMNFRMPAMASQCSCEWKRWMVHWNRICLIKWVAWFIASS